MNRGEIDTSIFISPRTSLNFWISHRYRPITPPLLPSLVVHACFPRDRTKSKDVFFGLFGSVRWPTRGGGFDLPNLIPTHERGKWTLDASLSTGSTRITTGDRASPRYEDGRGSNYDTILKDLYFALSFHLPRRMMTSFWFNYYDEIEFNLRIFNSNR